MTPLRRTTLLALALLTGCSPYTTRPFFPPVTGAATAELELESRDATETLAAVLRTDTLPVTTVQLRDGYIETAWFDAATKAATRRRPVGPSVVQVRAWVNPSRQGFSTIVVETVYRPLADPSRAPRDLEQQVPPDHPVGKRIEQVVAELAKLYNREEPAAAAPAEGPPAPPPQR